VSCTGGPSSAIQGAPTIAGLLAAPLLAAGMLLPLVGCASPSNSGQPAGGGRSLTSAILPNAKDAELRKKVEADHFPTAAQAGIQ
jgi:hypothetical protein